MPCKHCARPRPRPSTGERRQNTRDVCLLTAWLCFSRFACSEALFNYLFEATFVRQEPAEQAVTRHKDKMTDNLADTDCLTFLHVGCGPLRKEQATSAFAGPAWRELRLDIDASFDPDIVGTMTDMAAVTTGSVDALYSSHNLEHLYAHEIPKALAEFLRVLKADGFAVITCPDLQAVSALIAADKLTETLYVSPAGPIAPIDILYGHRASIAANNPFMAHRCGFTRRVLDATLRVAGFKAVISLATSGPQFCLWALASKAELTETELRQLAKGHFPSHA